MSAALRRVLLLGSGYTAAPLVEWLTRDGTVAVTIGKPLTSTNFFGSLWILYYCVASNVLEQAERVAAPYRNTEATVVDVTSDTGLSTLIHGHNLVIR